MIFQVYWLNPFLVFGLKRFKKPSEIRMTINVTPVYACCPSYIKYFSFFFIIFKILLTTAPFFAIKTVNVSFGRIG